MNRPSAPRVRLPAFGKELLELRRRGLVPNPPDCLVCLDGWKWGQSVTRVVVATDADPAALDYSMLAGLRVFVIYDSTHTAPARRAALLEKLSRCACASLSDFDIAPPADGPLIVPGKPYAEMTHEDHVANCDRLLTLLAAERRRQLSESAEHA